MVFHLLFCYITLWEDFFFFNLFIIMGFWLHWVFAAGDGLSVIAVLGLLGSGFSLLRSTGSPRLGFSRCCTWAQSLAALWP